ncbi:hypothetical protein J7K41_00090 [Candidatus Micrarchaeota archaeon]|nr:hypothetical protein [Candidatus Micrarchaeota archaeon]
MGKKICIICEKEREGVPIKEDLVIRTIRRIKEKLGIAKGYKLVVCRECWEEYVKRRKSYERNMITWGLLGLAAVIFMGILFAITGAVNIVRMMTTLIMLIAIFALMIGIVFITRYIPKTTMTLDEWLKSRRKRTGVKKTRKRKVKKK